MKLKIVSILAMSAMLLSSCSVMHTEDWEAPGLNDIINREEQQSENLVPDSSDMEYLTEEEPVETERKDNSVPEEKTADEEQDRTQAIADESDDTISDDPYEPKMEETNEYKEEAHEQVHKENLVDSMTDEQRMDVSIFLSNLSEADFTFTSSEYGEAENLINFAYIHAIINSYSMIVEDGGYEGLSAANVDSILDRFFGYTVPHKTPENSRRWVYRDGNFMVPAAAGASFSKFSIVTGMTKRLDGNFDVTFNIYRDPAIGGGNIITDKSIYYLTDSEAAERFEYVSFGEAVLKLKKRNGKDAYEIVSYKVGNGSIRK